MWIEEITMTASSDLRKAMREKPRRNGRWAVGGRVSFFSQPSILHPFTIYYVVPRAERLLLFFFLRLKPETRNQISHIAPLDRSTAQTVLPLPFFHTKLLIDHVNSKHRTVCKEDTDYSTSTSLAHLQDQHSDHSFLLFDPL